MNGETSVTWLDYYSDGLLKEIIDPDSNRTQYDYDARSRLDRVIEATVKDPDSGVYTEPTTTYSYDAANQLTVVSDPLGRVTTLAYDDLGRQTLITPPDPDGSGAGVSPTITY